jgi:pyruvate dehydrogenase E1 component beta subunit
VCGAEVPAPYAKHMEDASLPQATQIDARVREMLA